MPEVSVVVPTYNRAHTLGASLASLLGEGVDLEVIVVDDGSTDGTVDLLARAPDPRVRVLARPHGGIAVARNAGVAAARAAVIAFHDSDDLALPGRLTVPLAYLRDHPDVDVVIQNGRMLPPEDEPAAPAGLDQGPGALSRGEAWIPPAVARMLVDRAIGIADVFRWNLGQLQGVCFTRRCLLATGPFDASLDILDDLDLVLRATLHFRAAFVDVPAFAYRRHAGGVARDRTKVREEAIRVAEKLAREHPEALDLVGRDAFARRQARRYLRLARTRARAGDRGGTRAALARARSLAPGPGTAAAYWLRAVWLTLRSRG